MENEQEFVVASSMLHCIIFGNQTFQEAIKSTFPSTSPNKHLQPQVCSFVGCVLRHYTLIKEVCKNLILNEKATCAIYLAIANNSFLKKYKQDDMIAFAKDHIDPKDYAEVDRIFSHTDDLIKACGDLTEDSLDFISIRFNTPRWLVNMWQKHFGYAITFKVLRKNNRQQLQTVRVNTNKISTADFLAKHSDEFERSIVEDILIYKGKGQVRKTPYFRNLELFVERMPLKLVMDKVFDLEMGEALIISGENDSIIKEAYLKSKSSVGVHVAVPCLETRSELIKMERVIKPKNMSFFSAPDYRDLRASVSKQQDLVICYPESSSFDLIRQYPDYLLHFQHERIDQVIAKQKEALEAADEYLLDNSKLVYIVNTLNKKESRSIVYEFLKNHPNYEMVEEKQYLPFDEYDTALYYAIMLKKEAPTSND